MQKKKVISKKTLREFGLIFGIGLPLVIGWIIPTLFGHEPRGWTLLVGIPTLILSVMFPNILKLPYRLWMQVGLTLGWLNSKIILGLVFFLILIPISVLMKLFNYDPLQKSLIRNKSSYREITTNNKIDLTKIF